MISRFRSTTRTTKWAECEQFTFYIFVPVTETGVYHWVEILDGTMKTSISLGSRTFTKGEALCISLESCRELFILPQEIL